MLRSWKRTGVLAVDTWGEQGEPAVRQLWQDITTEQVSQTYLLAGPASEVKEQTASMFVQALLCQAPVDGSPCGQCRSCHDWHYQVHPDFHRLEAEGSTIKLDQIKSWRPFFNYRPQLGRHQVFYLAAPEILTAQAANSLLKILEEPLPQTVFLLVTEDENALLPTIISRCRVVLFRRVADPGSENKEQEPEQGELILRLIYEGQASELLGTLRREKYDRERARHLLKWLLAALECDYREQRARITAGDKDVGWQLLPVLELLLQGLQLLDDNVQVPLLLAITLRRVQKRLQ